MGVGMKRATLACLVVVWWLQLIVSSAGVGECACAPVALVRSQDREQIVSTEYGTISAVDLGGRYHLHFISLDPNSLFLPAILHTQMLLYVHTGSGRLSYIEVDGEDIKEVKLSRGDVYRLKPGTVFFLHSSLDQQRQRFRINTIFDKREGLGPYSTIHDLIRGFDNRLLQAAFQVSEEVIEEITNASCKMPPIVHTAAGLDKTTSFVDAIMGIRRQLIENNKKKKEKDKKTFNFFKEEPDVHNCDGWSTMVTSKRLHALKGSDFGVFMVNLTTSAMMGPHWNPMAAEIGVVLEGRGMVQVVCSSNLTRPESCRFLVEEGDVFIVPRFHPMAHMSFNNSTLVFMGFSTSEKNNHPQFLAGKASVLHVLSKRVLKLAFKVSDTALGSLLDARKGSVILDCVSCAEEEMEIWVEGERKRKEEEEIGRRQEEEKQRRREEEEERRQREEEEEEEERRRHKEEEERRKEEEEEERRRQEEEEERRKEEEEERRRHEEEEERRKEEEEERRRHEEEEERRKEEEEERRRHEEEEERRKEEEEEERRRQEEEEERRKEEEERRRQEEEEERRKEEEEEEEERHKEEEEEEEERQQHEEEEEERRSEEEEERRQHKEEEEAQKRKEEEEWRRQEEDEKRRMEEEERRQEEERRSEEKEKEDTRRRPGEARQEETEEEAATREEEERERQWERRKGKTMGASWPT